MPISLQRLRYLKFSVESQCEVQPAVELSAERTELYRAPDHKLIFYISNWIVLPVDTDQPHTLRGSTIIVAAMISLTKSGSTDS